MLKYVCTNVNKSMVHGNDDIILNYSKFMISGIINMTKISYLDT